MSNGTLRASQGRPQQAPRCCNIRTDAMKSAHQTLQCRRIPTLRRDAGMTLIEILVVLVLIGVVMGIVGSNFLGRAEKAKADAAKIDIGQISQALDLYKLEVGRYPTTQEGLQA